MPSFPRILVSGSQSGLGRYLFDRFGAIGWTRDLPSEEKTRLREEGVDVILHCAFNPRSQLIDTDFYSYINDNVLLTRELCQVRHAKIIYLSTVDVYPKTEATCLEDMPIRPGEIRGIYGLTKHMSECIVQREGREALVLRCSALLGKDARPNSLSRMITDEGKGLSLSGDSIFNYISHREVGDFIEVAMARNVIGTYNLVSSGNVTLMELASVLGRKVRFGQYRYETGCLSNEKARALMPAIGRSSLETALEFCRELERGVL